MSEKRTSFNLQEQDIQRLDRIKDVAYYGSKTVAVKNAVRVFDEVLDQIVRGNTVVFKSDKEETTYNPLCSYKPKVG